MRNYTLQRILTVSNEWVSDEVHEDGGVQFRLVGGVVGVILKPLGTFLATLKTSLATNGTKFNQK